jgi:hypothetical protein
MKIEHLLKVFIGFWCLMFAVIVGWSMYMDLHPQPQQTYQSVQTIRIEYGPVPQPETKDNHEQQ